MAELIVIALLALALGLLLGWLLASRRSGSLASDLAVAQTRAADADLIRRARDEVERERNAAMQGLAALREKVDAAEAAHRATAARLESVEVSAHAAAAERNIAHAKLAALDAQASAREQAHRLTLEEMNTRFDAAAAKALETAQTQFLERAQQRFTESEKLQGERLSALLQPVNDKLQRYEEGVHKIEAERRDAFGVLHGQIEAMRAGQERVSTEAAKIVNSLRSAPKARGSWGEQQLKNVLEMCGLSEHADFQTEVSVATEDERRLRPDVIVRIPGGKTLVIDSKVSLNSYQDAHGALEDSERKRHIDLHVKSMRSHVDSLSAKAYWSQFKEAPDFVIMFVPGEHLLSAALDAQPRLWEEAFEKRVLIATPANLVAIARTVSAVWRQEKLADDARRIGELGRELYERLATSAQHLRVVGSGLSTAVNNYNKFVGSFERNVLSSGRKLRDMNIETPSRPIGDVDEVESLARYGDERRALPGGDLKPVDG